MLKPFNRPILVVAAASLSSTCLPAAVTLISEDFESLPDQSSRPISDFGSNIPIGFTNTDPAESGADVWYRNGMRAFATTPDANFTIASGNRVAQLVSHSSGGYSTISVPLGNGTPGSGTDFLPIPTGALSEGDIIRLSFDMYVQNVPSGSLAFNWNTDSASGTQNGSWTEYTSASPGDQFHFSRDLVITSDLTDITTIAPQFQLSTNGGSSFPFSTNYGQIDNFVLEIIPIPEPSTFALAGLGGLALLRRRR